MKKNANGAYRPRRCDVCLRGFRPRYPNQRTHSACGPKLRRQRNKAYQQRARRDMKRDLSLLPE